jgi:hypothetical protein
MLIKLLKLKNKMVSGGEKIIRSYKRKKITAIEKDE